MYRKYCPGETFDISSLSTQPTEKICGELSRAVVSYAELW